MTATTQAEVMTRVFRLASLELDDPDPQASPEEALTHWESSYPILAHASLAAPSIEGNTMVFDVIKPKGETKG
ncbi:hypothetical protein J7355_13570 [Endozoicomonas sp. G2_2]|uniref:PRTRC system protein C n=1 Tax=Endozoicomonas sp. G2_2 TaxID=2821092 RepID=UPI001ADB60FA|nr:PRTRC system protein C [Endozoicomonas sp. G2_2]MBO9471125.1 hypothetical protein [Endozoicomonas sp. G2_2]